MKFHGIQFDHFGGLRSQTFELGAINVVVGPNEAGKSTFCMGIETLFYGFSPAKRDDHPLYAWDGGSSDLRLTAHMETDHGGSLLVERELQSTGKSRRIEGLSEAQVWSEVTWSGSRSTNKALGEVAGTERSLYRALWSLELGDFKDFGGKVQASIDELVLPQVDGMDLVPTRTVLVDLEGAAKEQFREKGNGKSVERSLKAERGVVREELADARALEADLREMKEGLPQLEQSLVEHKARHAEMQVERHELEAMEEVGKLLREEAELTRVGGEPHRRLEDPAVVASQLADLDRRLAAPVARLERDAIEADRAGAAVLEQRMQIVGLGQGIALFESDEAAVKQDSQEQAAGVERLAQDVEDYLDGGAAEVAFEWLGSAPVSAIQSGVKDWRAAILATQQVEGLGTRQPWGIGFLVGLGLLIAGLLVAGPLRFGLGLFGAALVAWSFFRGLPPRGEASPEAGDQGGMPASLRARFEGLDLADELMGSIDSVERLLPQLENWKRELLRLEGLAERLADEQAGLETRAAEWAQLARELGIEVEVRTGRDASLVQRESESLLEQAAADVKAAEEDAAERGRAQSERAAFEEERKLLLGTQEALHGELRRGVAALGHADFDADAAFEHHESCRQRSSNLADARRRLVERFGDLTELEASCHRWSPEKVAEIEAEARQLGTALEALYSEVAEQRHVLQGSMDWQIPRLVDRLDEIEAERIEARREHDRLRLLAALLKRADRDYRQEHEPDVLRVAGQYLAEFTGGRYGRLQYGDADREGQRALEVQGSDGEQRPVSAPLSRGTRDQIQLALRLALLDHLDGDRERLPLVLDEVLVHWDAQRRAAIYGALSTLSETRQIFIMTCHEAFAEEAAGAFGVQPIRLGAAQS